jgi:hypothetical protein
MSLNDRIAKIAADTVSQYVNGQIALTTNTSTSSTSNTNLAGEIQSFDQDTNLFTVQFPDGTTTTCPPAGVRPLGPGDGVIVSNGQIIG